ADGGATAVADNGTGTGKNDPAGDAGANTGVPDDPDTAAAHGNTDSPQGPGSGSITGTEPTSAASSLPTSAPEATPTPETTPTLEPTPTTEPFDPTEPTYYYDPNIDPSKPIIALSFDDGPSSHTDRILAALKKYNVKATFFMVGYEIDSFPDQVRAVYDAGCEVANHTLDHANLKEKGKDEIRRQVYDNEKKLNNLVPVGEVIVRPPYGNVNDTVKSVVERPMFNWSVDSLDWKTRNADSVVAQIKQDARDGYIILMHDLYESTAEATERIIPWLLEQGYQITCISNMFEARGDEVLPGHLYRYATPLSGE
ncbi:MAG: polysaccharide deacetylase family protein, partial [Lachnospiraceae bacterium]|nr:polysaccharide deacetylase family protein [Lachnospiraceae bacterium]